jgi:hypothetical protein
MDVRRAHDESGAVRHGQARERDGLVKRLRTVVDTGQEVEVQFDARALQSSTSAPELM